MSNLDEMKAAFAKKLDEKRAVHASRTEAEINDLRASLSREFRAAMPPEAPRRRRR